jgi:hypothetical protein
MTTCEIYWGKLRQEARDDLQTDPGGLALKVTAIYWGFRACFRPAERKRVRSNVFPIVRAKVVCATGRSRDVGEQPGTDVGLIIFANQACNMAIFAMSFNDHPIAIVKNIERFLIVTVFAIRVMHVKEQLMGRRRHESLRDVAPCGPAIGAEVDSSSPFPSRRRQPRLETTMTTTEMTFERHFSVEELSELWGMGDEFLRRLFLGEPGVVIFYRERPGKRMYRTLRIPESVALRVHRRLQRS